MDVSENSGTPNHPFLTGFSIINHPFWGTPIFGNTLGLIPWKLHKNKIEKFPVFRRFSITWSIYKPPEVMKQMQLSHLQTPKSNHYAVAFVPHQIKHYCEAIHVTIPKRCLTFEKNSNHKSCEKIKFPSREVFSPPSLHQRDNEKATI